MEKRLLNYQKMKNYNYNKELLRTYGVKEDVICNIFELSNIIQCSGMCDAVIIIGSIAKGLYNLNNSSIDLIILTKKLISKTKLLDVLKQYNLNFYQSDDIYILEKTNISIYIKDYNCYLEYLKNIILNKNNEVVVKEWAIGGVVKDVILDDISKAIFLYDSRNDFLKLANMLKETYVIATNVGGELVYQLIKKVDLTLSQFYAKNYLLGQIGFFESIVLLERLYCHENRMYNPGFKHVIKNNEEFICKYNLNVINQTEICVNDMVEILEEVKEIYT